VPKRKNRDPDRTKTSPGRMHPRPGGKKEKTRLTPARYAKKLAELFQDNVTAGMPTVRAMEAARKTMQTSYLQRIYRKGKF
jgi:hypothetical protein